MEEKLKMPAKKGSISFNLPPKDEDELKIIIDDGISSMEELFAVLGLRKFQRHLNSAVDVKKWIFLLVFIALYFIGFIYCAFISKLLPATGHWLLDSIKNDYYYCYLVPLTIVPTFIVVYLNWLSMKFFENN